MDEDYIEETYVGVGSDWDAYTDLLEKYAGVTDREQIVRYSTDENPLIREGIASNPSAGEEVLRRLSTDVDADVRASVAANPNTPLDILARLVKDREEVVREAFLNRSDIPVEMQEELAGDVSVEIRRKMADHAGTPAGLLSRLAGDDDRYVRWHVAANPRTPLEALLRLAEDINVGVREAAAENPAFKNESELKLSDMATEKIEFASVEQGFQYIKTYFSGGDADALDALRGRILATTDGASLRQLGREIPALDRESWDREAPGIMHDLVLESFRANPKAAVELLATGDAIITHEQDGSRWREEFPKILMQVREELRNPERGPDRGVSYYAGSIEPGGDVVFVFGSNPEGRHGAGAARVAASKFGAVKGVGEGLQGSSYALPTKDLRVTRNHGYRSISEVDIMENIRRMYECAEQNPERRFMVAYTNAPDERTLNGYTGAEMVAMFVGADGGRIPSNVVFSDAWREEMDRQLASLDAANNHAVEVHAAAGEQADDMKYDELKSAFCRFWDDNLKVTKDFDGFYENMVASFRETQGQAFGKEGYARAERFVSEMERDLELMDYLTRSLNYSASAKTQRAYKDKDINIYFSTDEHKELSNLAIRRFNYKPAQGSDVLHFCSVEQAYQYMKTFHSDAPADVLEDYRKKILDAGIYSGTAKKLGSTIPGMRKEEWEAASVEYMRTFVRESFRNNPEAQEALLATSGHRLTHNQDRGRWNKLFPSILMEVRDMLEAEKRTISQKGSLYVSHYGSRSVPEDAYIVQISTTTPDGVTPDFQFKQVYPSWKEMVGPYRDGTIDDKGYTARYVRDVLDRHHDDILDTLKKIQTDAKGRDIYFMCYEKPGDFCHRYLFNNFLNENGIVCKENPADRMKYTAGRVVLFGEEGYEPFCQAELQHSIVFTESTGSYAQRTRENAAAPDVHFTVAFARDFSTYGEKCTAMAAGDSLIQIELPYTRTGHISLSEDSVMKGAETLLSMLPDEFFSGKDVQPSGWNIAGNGIYTLGTPQSEIDEYVTKVFAVAMDRGLNPVSFRSGGQTGVDEAGAVAGQVLGIPTVVHAPKGFKMRNAEGRDICGRDAFTQRFRDKDYAGLRKSVDALVQGLHKERKNKASMKFGI